MKHRIVHTLQKYLLNPPIKLALSVGVPLPGYALLETRGRKTGRPRRTPVGDGRIGNQFWLVAEHGMKAGYVRNIERDPRVRRGRAECPPKHSLYFFGCDSGFSCFGAGICPCSLVGGTMPLILM